MADRWLKSFRDFYNDIGPRPSPKHSLDRWPNKDGHYEPGNVRWATQYEQMANTRANDNYTIDGVTKCLTEWTREYSIHPATVRSRLKRGLSIEEALTARILTPQEKGNDPELQAKRRAGVKDWWENATEEELLERKLKLDAAREVRCQCGAMLLCLAHRFGHICGVTKHRFRKKHDISAS